MEHLRQDSPEKQTPHSVAEIVDALRGTQEDTKGLLLKIRELVIKHAEQVPKEKQKNPKSIIESRFTSAQEAYEAGMLSCGAMSNMATAVLRELGYKVKLVHGENKDSVDHAWIAVQEAKSGQWIEYDITRPDMDITASHMKKAEVENWEDIREQIESDDQTLLERRRARGLPEFNHD